MIGAYFCRKARCERFAYTRHPELPKSCLRTCQDVVRRTPARSSFNYCHHYYDRAIISHRDRTTFMNYYYYCRYTYARHGECPPPTIRGLLDQSMQQSEPYIYAVWISMRLKNYKKLDLCRINLRKREKQQFPSPPSQLKEFSRILRIPSEYFFRVL